MTELQEIVDLSQGNLLIKQLKQTGYSFAAWRMPFGKQTHLIISLSNQIQSSDFKISNADKGFVINTYSDSHPICPYHISADIIVSENNISINPSIKSSELDEFKRKINSIEYSKEKSRSDYKHADNAYIDIAAEAIKEVKKGTFEKVVPSRYLDEPIPDNFSPWNFFQTICDQYENAFCSITCIGGKDLWVGATPELLISNNDRQFKTTSLAGTKSLEEGQNLSEIAWTQKEIEEQALVSRYIINCFKKIRLREFHEYGPKTVQAGNLAHLKTEFIVNYDELSFDLLADQMLELLHPTSAVCGMPIESAKSWILERENYDREFFTGFLGPVNFENSTDLFVNLRCIKITSDTIRFYAGAGVTEDSIPEKELIETEMKMNVMKKVINIKND